MKVLLIHPRALRNINTRLPESLNKQRGVVPSLGIAYIAAVLEGKGHFVRILDIPALNLTKKEVCQEIKTYQPEVVGITSMTPTILAALEIAKMVKTCIDCFTILGGPALSSYPHEILSYPYVDFGVNGEGEYVMLKLIECIEKKNPPGNIEGLIYKKDNRVIVNPPTIVEDIDSLPFPAYHLLPMNTISMVFRMYNEEVNILSIVNKAIKMLVEINFLVFWIDP